MENQDTKEMDSLQVILDRIPFIDFIGARFDLSGGELVSTLPFDCTLIGNGFINALHGGAIASFLETTAQIELAWYLETKNFSSERAEPIKLPKTIDFTVDYIYSGKAKQSFAKAVVNRSGKRYASLSVEAWQDRREQPFAKAIGHFLIPK